MDYRYERLSKDNIHHLKTLFKLVFKKTVTIHFLMNKYNTAYLGKSFLGHIAFNGDRPVAYGGFIPYRIQFKDYIELAAQSVDSMALKEVSGKGVFKKIWYLNEKLLQSEGIAFGYGFGNQDSVPVFVHKFNWYTNERLIAFIIPVKVIPLARILNKLGLHHWYKRRVKRSIQDLLIHESFKNPFDLEGHAFTTYDDDFFQYKSDEKRYMVSIDGVKVWIKTDHRLSIGHIEDCSKEQFHQVIEKLISLSKRIGLNEIFLQYSPGAKQVDMLKEKYKALEASPICFKNFSTAIPLDKILFAHADLDTF